jgi:propionate catabolism operon transcriptional regulator
MVFKGVVMSKKPFRIGIITSSISLANHVSEIAHSSEDVIQASSKGLEEAIPIGRNMERDGVEVIISRKGTARLLRENLNIPVISVPLSALDILSCLSEAVRYGEKILLPSFRTSTIDTKIIEELLPVKLMQGVYEDFASLKELIHYAKSEGCQVVAGGGLGVRLAQECGMKGIEIKTSEEVMETSLESARSVVRAQRKDKRKAELYRCIIDSVSEGIIAVDMDGRIITTNKIARELFNIDQKDIIGEPVHRFIPETSLLKSLNQHKPIYEKLEHIGKKLFIFNHIPVIMEKEAVGGVTTFTDTSNIIRTESEVRRTVTRGLKAKYLLKDLTHRSEKMRKTINTATRYAATDSTILIYGETGTGKELVAQGIHNLSTRKKGPFVSINCAAIPEQLLESELFGYEDGAFTGSKKGGKPGQFEMAHKGTILLDEISATTETVQIRLLRILQEREVMRIGGNRLIPVDVRVLANTNKDLVEEAQAGRFREDLFFRLNVLEISIVPLRERQEDIPLLAEEFIRKDSKKYSLSPIVIPEAIHEPIMRYEWPGNVRQLQHFIERLVLLCNGRFSNQIFNELYDKLVRYKGVSKTLDESGMGEGTGPDRLIANTENEKVDPPTDLTLKKRLKQMNQDGEVEIIRKALETAHYNRGKTAQLLGISRATLWKKMKALNF